MLTEYIKAAMKRARYEILKEDGSFYGEIPDLRGCWANANTLEGCRDELEEVVEGWVILGLRHGHKIPELDGIKLDPVEEPTQIEADQET